MNPPCEIPYSATPYPLDSPPASPRSQPSTISSAPKTERTLSPSIHSIPMIPESTSTSTTCGTRTPPRAQRVRDRASEVMRARVSCAESAGCRYFLGNRYLRRMGRPHPASLSVRYALYTFCASHQSAVRSPRLRSRRKGNTNCFSALGNELCALECPP